MRFVGTGCKSLGEEDLPGIGGRSLHNDGLSGSVSSIHSLFKVVDAPLKSPDLLILVMVHLDLNPDGNIQENDENPRICVFELHTFYFQSVIDLKVNRSSELLIDAPDVTGNLLKPREQANSE